MRYTKFNPDLGCWEVPCLYKTDGSAITFNFRVEPGECFYDSRGVMTHQTPGPTYVSGEVIERLAELENLIEATPSQAKYDVLLRRFRHLLKSDYIRSFDRYDPRTGTYARDIKEADRENL